MQIKFLVVVKSFLSVCPCVHPSMCLCVCYCKKCHNFWLFGLTCTKFSSSHLLASNFWAGDLDPKKGIFYHNYLLPGFLGKGGRVVLNLFGNGRTRKGIYPWPEKTGPELQHFSYKGPPLKLNSKNFLFYSTFWFNAALRHHRHIKFLKKGSVSRFAK